MSTTIKRGDALVDRVKDHAGHGDALLSSGRGDALILLLTQEQL